METTKPERDTPPADSKGDHVLESCLRGTSGSCYGQPCSDISLGTPVLREETAMLSALHPPPLPLLLCFPSVNAQGDELPLAAPRTCHGSAS